MTAWQVPPSSDWVAEVRRLMIDIGTEFADAETDRRRELAGAAVAQLTVALADLGVFDGPANVAQDALKQLTVMIRDLEHGRRHPWSIPTNFGGTRVEQVGDREVRLWAIIAAELLDRAGVKPEAAYRQIKAKLESAGHRYASAKKWHTSFRKDGRKSDVERVREALADRAAQYADPVESARLFLTDPDGVLPWLIEQSSPVGLAGRSYL